MENKKVCIFGGPVMQKVDPVLSLVPTGGGELARTIFEEMKKHFFGCELIGNFSGKNNLDFKGIEEAIENLDANIVIFMPHLPNFLVAENKDKTRLEKDVGVIRIKKAPKLLNRIKEKYPEVLLVPFKLADPDMPVVEILRWMLDAHSALAVYSRLGDSKRYWILDVLGNEIEVSKAELPRELAKTILGFTKAVRRRSECAGNFTPDVPHLSDFVNFSRKMQPAFSQIMEKNVGSGRWPGNFSFRCTHGFMSVRHGEGFIITKRNVDKTGLTEQDFVFVKGSLENEKIIFLGTAGSKPSIDTPVHRYIYENLSWVRSIVHGHLFLKGENVHPELINRWPCGSENEAYEIIRKAPIGPQRLWMVNVDGHGFVALIGETDIASSLDSLAAMEYSVKSDKTK